MTTNRVSRRLALQNQAIAALDDSRAELVLKVAIVYDASSAGQHAIEVLQQIEAEREPRIRFSLTVWRFDRLSRAASRYHATDDVIDADLVILSLAEPHSIPDSASSWLARCLQRKQGRPGEVLLLSVGDTWSATVGVRDGVLTFEKAPLNQRMVA